MKEELKTKEEKLQLAESRLAGRGQQLASTAGRALCTYVYM
jgi:hypothetical protein